MIVMIEFETPAGNPIMLNVALLVAVTWYNTEKFKEPRFKDVDVGECSNASMVSLTTGGEDGVTMYLVAGTPKEVFEKMNDAMQAMNRRNAMMQGVPR